MALLDGGFAALAASSNPNDKAAVAKAMEGKPGYFSYSESLSIEDAEKLFK